MVLEVEAGWSQARGASGFLVRPARRRGRAPGPQLCSAFQPPPHRSRARAAHLRRAPQPGVGPHRIAWALDRPSTGGASVSPRPPREQAHAALRAPPAAAYRREEAGTHPRRRWAPRAWALRRDPAYPRPRLPARRRRRPQPLRLRRRPARRARRAEQALAAFPPWRARARRAQTAHTVSTSGAAAAGVELGEERQGRALHPDPAERVGYAAPTAPTPSGCTSSRAGSTATMLGPHGGIGGAVASRVNNVRGKNN